MTHDPDWGFETLAIHAGQEPDPTTGAVITSISQTSTFAQSEVGVHSGYEYSRSGNPTRTALETCLGALSEGRRAWRTRRGWPPRTGCCARSACPAATWSCRTTRTVGRTGCSTRCCGAGGVAHTAVPLGDLDAVRAAVRPETALVWAETPTNPLLGVADIAGLSDALGSVPEGP